MDVIRLLRSKNRCLERFLTASDEFLVLARNGDFSGLESFHKKRDRILKGFDLYDRKLTECIETLPEAQASTEMAQEAEQALNIKDVLIRKIAETDALIVEQIEMEKNRLLMEMASAQKNSSIVKKFKSNWATGSGEELDETL